MSLYQLRSSRCQARPVPDADTAAALLGGVGTQEGTAWTVEVARENGLTLTYSGEVGDYLVSDPWRVVAAAEFEAAWIQALDLASIVAAIKGATTILGLRAAMTQLATTIEEAL